MLLLMENAQVDTLGCFVGQALVVVPRDGIFYVSAVGKNVVEFGTREGGAQLLFRLVGDVVVITVEEPEEVGMEGAIAGEVFTKNEGFKEPRGVGQVPFCRACLRTALHHHVFWCQRSRKREALPARRGECCQESGR